jgi:hypothetical protein
LALAYAAQLSELGEPRGMREAAARALLFRGQALAQRNDHAAAAAALQEAAAREQQLGRPRLAQDIQQALTRLHHEKRHLG